MGKASGGKGGVAGREKILDALLATLVYVGLAQGLAGLARSAGLSVPGQRMAAFAAVLTAAGWMWLEGASLEEAGLKWSRPVWALGWAFLAIVTLVVPGAALWAWISGGEAEKMPVGVHAWLNFAGYQLFWVGFPEEIFFRGAIQGTLQRGDGPRHRYRALLGVMGSSLLFALAHVVAEHSLRGLRVFLPGILFGFLRARTGSVFSPALVHAASNVALTAFQAHGW